MIQGPQIDGGVVLERNILSTKKIVINRGGTRSGKSYSLAQLAVLFLISGYVSEQINLPTGVWSIVRKTLPSLKASVLRDFEEILTNYNLWEYVKQNKTELTYRIGDRMVEFFSIDDQQKVRSRKRNVLNVCEANEISYDDFRQLLFRTSERVYLDFNPDDPNTWIKTELEDKRQYEVGDVEVIVSTYKDNPFLQPEIRREIELLERTDPQFWQIFGMGEYGRITGLIFPHVNIVSSIPSEAKLIGHGLDFGFTNDPTACYEVYLLHGELWVNELLYERGLTNPDIHIQLWQMGVDKTKKVVCDSAEPKSIAELNNLGLWAVAAKKGPDSIKAGIDILKRYKINITSRSTGLLKEQKSYKWKTDKDGNTLNEPIEAFNHGWDALRYLALNELNYKNQAREICVY